MRSRPPFRHALALALIAFALASPRPATAQYMFLDANGDGANDFTDYLIGSGTVTVDVYLDTARNSDGSPAVCQANPSETLSLRGYSLSLYNSFEPVEITDIVSLVPGMGELFAPRVFPYALSVAYARGEPLPPGRYHLLRMTVRLLGREASLEIVRSSCFSPVGSETSFWSDCLGFSYDGVLRLGEDWTDVSSLISSPHSVPIYHPPAISCPGEVTGREGEPLAFTVSLFDADCADPGMGWSALPAGVSISPLGPFVEGAASRTVTWTPGFDQAGVHSVLFSATESYPYWPGPTHYDSCRTTITILEGNQRPVADAGGPYFGLEGVAVAFDGSGSSDPDGGALEFLWSYGDGNTGTGPTPSHVYEAPDFYLVTLTVTEPGGLTAEDGTFADILEDNPTLPKAARIFARPGFETTRLPHGRPEACFQIEPSEPGSFDPASVDPATVVLGSATCNVFAVEPTSVKPWRVADSDRNGIPEVSACFSIESLTTAFQCLPPGQHRLRLVLSASVMSGEQVYGEFDHTFVLGGGLGVRVWPNPLNPSAVLIFTTSRRGWARAYLYDVRGRLVATLAEERALEAGEHRVAFEGTTRNGDRLPSGVYFVRVRTEHDSAETRTITILK